MNGLDLFNAPAAVRSLLFYVMACEWDKQSVNLIGREVNERPWTSDRERATRYLILSRQINRNVWKNLTAQQRQWRKRQRETQTDRQTDRQTGRRGRRSETYIRAINLLVVALEWKVKVKVRVLSLDPKLALTTSQFYLWCELYTCSIVMKISIANYIVS